MPMQCSTVLSAAHDADAVQCVLGALSSILGSSDARAAHVTAAAQMQALALDSLEYARVREHTAISSANHSSSTHPPAT